MPRSRSPDRNKAMEMYLTACGDILLKDIAASLGVSDTQVRKWKNQDQWEARLKGNVTNQKSNVTKRRGGAPPGNQNAAGHGAPAGNQNAKGNAGGPGGPARNKKALKTGEYEAIWMDALDDTERDLVGRMDTDPMLQLDEEITLLSIRERRMMVRIKRLTDGLTEKQKRVVQELRNFKQAIPVPAEDGNKNKIMVRDMEKLVVSQIEETEIRPIEDILRLEEALTRVQDKKLKALELKRRNTEEDGDDDDGDPLESLAAALRESAALLRGDG